MFKKIFSLFLLAFTFSLLASNIVFADPMDQLVGSDGQIGGYSSKTIAGDTLNTKTTVPDMISNGIKIALGLFGSVALIFVIWGGVDWMLSKGDGKKIGLARDRMVAAAIGLAIIAASYAITDFVISQIAVIAG